MSSDLAAEEADNCCANCGVKEIDGIKLKICTACKSVRYCGRKCQKDHRPKHKRACKQRAAELRDEILFRQPESSHLGDCPICFLPLPFEAKTSPMKSCCGKIICNGCDFANKVRESDEGHKHKYPFCRKPVPNNDEEAKKNHENRATANDPPALQSLGFIHCEKGDYDSAFGYWTRAAELGDAQAHYNLSIMYYKGEGVEKDAKMEIYHLEEAAIAGHPYARFRLGLHEGRNERHDRAVKHFIIAANLGHEDSLEMLKDYYKGRLVSKDDLASALREHQAAVDAMKSPQREAAAQVVNG